MFPKCLTERRQWITWTLTAEGKKIPNSPSNQPKTWFDYDEVKGNDRIAYVFSSDDPFVGIDLDKCIDEHGNYNDVATYCLDLFKGSKHILIELIGMVSVKNKDGLETRIFKKI